MKKILKRYRAFLAFLAVDIVLVFALPEIGKNALEISFDNLLEMLSIVPPIFILLGLLDVWVDKETMMKYLGEGSGLRGMLIAFALGAAAAGPLYASFPVATVMLRKGTSLFNTFVFIGAWSVAKIPLLTFEATSLGLSFMLTRFVINIFGILIIAVVVERSLNEKQKAEVYEIAESQD